MLVASMLREMQCGCIVFNIFVFKQKTAYEMRISDWSADVCSSNLPAADQARLRADVMQRTAGNIWLPNPGPQTEAYFCPADLLLYGGQGGGGKTDLLAGLGLTEHRRSQIGRASCRERVCQYV